MGVNRESTRIIGKWVLNLIKLVSYVSKLEFFVVDTR